MLYFRIFLFRCFFMTPPIVSFKYTIIVFFLFLGFNSLNSMISGWSTFTKYSIIGSLRTVSQLISYEAVLYLCLFFFVLLINCFDLFRLYSYYSQMIIFFLIPCFYIWVPTILAELNRTPFDFSEGERELVRGFNIEYGSLGFTLIFLREYSNILFFRILSGFIFFSELFFSFFFLLLFIIWIRSVLPRFRFDKLIYLAWKSFIPFLTIYFLIFIIYLF